jgi:hypothetical protein
MEGREPSLRLMRCAARTALGTDGLELNQPSPLITNSGRSVVDLHRPSARDRRAAEVAVVRGQLGTARSSILICSNSDVASRTPGLSSTIRISPCGVSCDVAILNRSHMVQRRCNLRSKKRRFGSTKIIGRTMFQHWDLRLRMGIDRGGSPT